MSAEAEATGLPDVAEARPADGARQETVAPGLVRDVRFMADGRRITYYRRERQ